MPQTPRRPPYQPFLDDQGTHRPARKTLPERLTGLQKFALVCAALVVWAALLHAANAPGNTHADTVTTIAQATATAFPPAPVSGSYLGGALDDWEFVHGAPDAGGLSWARIASSSGFWMRVTVVLAAPRAATDGAPRVDRILVYPAAPGTTWTPAQAAKAVATFFPLDATAHGHVTGTDGATVPVYQSPDLAATFTPRAFGAAAVGTFDWACISITHNANRLDVCTIGLGDADA